MFDLGIIALVLQTTLELQSRFQFINVISYFIGDYVWATIACLTVRSHDAFLPSA
jgi:hypothetical protein